MKPAAPIVPGRYWKPAIPTRFSRVLPRPGVRVQARRLRTVLHLRLFATFAPGRVTFRSSHSPPGCTWPAAATIVPDRSAVQVFLAGPLYGLGRASSGYVQRPPAPP